MAAWKGNQRVVLHLVQRRVDYRQRLVRIVRRLPVTREVLAQRRHAAVMQARDSFLHEGRDDVGIAAEHAAAEERRGRIGRDV